jgi:predicted GIY-YIG superfamily endonuclease
MDSDNDNDNDNNTIQDEPITATNDTDIDNIQPTEVKGPYFVYLLASNCGKYTYVGSTNNLARRLRQHNGEIVGGAKYTTKKGPVWTRIGHVSGFPTWQSALQFEWKWKQLTRKLKLTGSPAEKRWSALRHLVRLPKSTAKAEPFATWPTPPCINRE